MAVTQAVVAQVQSEDGPRSDVITASDVLVQFAHVMRQWGVTEDAHLAAAWPTAADAYRKLAQRLPAGEHPGQCPCRCHRAR